MVETFQTVFSAILILLPKSENAIAVQDFCPMSLMNTDAKIFAHIVCNRIKKDLCKIVKSVFAWKTSAHSNTKIEKSDYSRTIG